MCITFTFASTLTFAFAFTSTFTSTFTFTITLNTFNCLGPTRWGHAFYLALVRQAPMPRPQVTATLSLRLLLLFLDAEYHSNAHVGLLLLCMSACPFVCAPGGSHLWVSSCSASFPPVLCSLCSGILAARSHVHGPSDSTFPATPTLRVHGREQIPRLLLE